MTFVFEEDLFDVKDVDKDGKFFAKVSRIHAQSENYDTELVVDVNVEVYPMEIADKFQFALASTLNKDKSEDNGLFDQSGKDTIAEKYEYVMHGKVFKYEADAEDAGKTTVYASFGGLMMTLKGETRNLQGIEQDSRVFLLIRKM